MPAFSEKSKAALATAHPELQRLFNDVIRHVNCTVITGHRGQGEQNAAYLNGKSNKRWPDGKHNSFPSKAVDVAPYPIDWDDTERFRMFWGFVYWRATLLGIKIRWGGDWDGDGDMGDQKLIDLVHFELLAGER